MRLLWLLVATLLVTSCSYGNRPTIVIGGRDFPVNVARELRAGVSDSDVRRLIGPPLTVSTENDTELWHYEVATTDKEDIKLLGLIPMPSKDRGGKTIATLTFRNKVLSRVIVVDFPTR